MVVKKKKLYLGKVKHYTQHKIESKIGNNPWQISTASISVDESNQLKSICKKVKAKRIS